MTDRGERLHQEKRKKAKMRKILKGFILPGHNSENLLSPRSVGLAAHTPHPCSGRCCGNPRCHCKGKDKLTLQELKEIERERE